MPLAGAFFTRSGSFLRLYSGHWLYRQSPAKLAGMRDSSIKITSEVRPNVMQGRETKTIAAAAPELAGKTIAVAETRELDVRAALRATWRHGDPLSSHRHLRCSRPNAHRGMVATVRRGSMRRSGLIHWGGPKAPPPFRGAYRAAGRVRQGSRSCPKDYPRTQAGPGAQGDRSCGRSTGRGADHGGHHRHLDRFQSHRTDGRHPALR